MARKPKPVYERIIETQDQIKQTEQKVEYLRKQLEKLYAEKEEQEMNDIWNTIKEKNLSYDQVKEILTSAKTQ